MKKFFLFVFLLPINASLFAQSPDTPFYHEQFRPQLHFSPKAHWMNDPNGMVYFNHTYHLFFQYYPNGTVWGPMHWGHAVSKDLVHWKELPVAIYPDRLGYIFSGSAVVDSNNTSGFGKKGKIPLVAIFTQHDPKRADAGRKDFQNQSIAYSLDGGYTWTKYVGNPVLKNPGKQDFRDPKVSWYGKDKKWIMTLAVGDHIEFYSSPNLKSWTKESEFGKGAGAHGGVWECPDLFPMKLNGKTHWILIVNINPGGPNKGSATQYFVGQFDGRKFTPADTLTRWLDYGPDEYAGVTWSNTGDRRIFQGWMSNWLYATQVPTSPWRSAFTLPRELSLFLYNEHIFLKSKPLADLTALNEKNKRFHFSNAHLGSLYDVSQMIKGQVAGQYILKMTVPRKDDFEFRLENEQNEVVRIGYNKKENQFYIDRTQAGINDFNKDFSGVEKAPRLSDAKSMRLTAVIDRASVELFADDGKTVMTSIFFPKKSFDWIEMGSDKRLQIVSLTCIELRSIW